MTLKMAVLGATGFLCAGLLAGCGQTTGQTHLAQHKQWFNGKFWSEAQCTILSAGVAVNSRNWDLGPKRDQAVGQVPLAISPSITFFPAPGTACPGAYTCAEEKGNCVCFGVVTYTTNADMSVETGLFEFKSATQRVKSYGSIICSHDKDIGGAFTLDPSPKNDPLAAKSCVCHPAEIEKQIPKKGTDLGLQESAKRALTDWNAMGGTPATIATFRSDALQNQSPSMAKEQSANITHEDAEVSDQQGRRLINTRRRRRTLQYAPWALVKVSGAAGERVRCAFEYGVARASFDKHGDDRPIRTAADPIVENLGHPGDRVPCWVRDGGESGKDECAVAMERPEEGLEQLAVDLANASADVQVLIGIAACSLVLGMVASISCLRSSRKLEDAKEHTLSYSPLED